MVVSGELSLIVAFQEGPLCSFGTFFQSKRQATTTNYFGQNPEAKYLIPNSWMGFASAGLSCIKLVASRSDVGTVGTCVVAT